MQTVYQGREDISFWKTMNLDGPPKDAYQQIAQWSYLYIDLEVAKTRVNDRHTVVK